MRLLRPLPSAHCPGTKMSPKILLCHQRPCAFGIFDNNIFKKKLSPKDPMLLRFLIKIKRINLSKKYFFFYKFPSKAVKKSEFVQIVSPKDLLSAKFNFSPKDPFFN